MTRYEECSDPMRLAAWRAEHGPGSVQGMWPGGPWGSSMVTDVASFVDFMRFNRRYRLVIEDPEPPALPEGAPADAVPSPWTEGAVICLLSDVPDGWECRFCVDAAWLTGRHGRFSIVEARPVPVPEPPATDTITPTPETLHELIGRVVDGETIERVEQDRYGWSAYFVGGGPHLGARWDEHWSVLADPSGGVR